MNKTTKRLIAKEGLVIIGVVVISILIGSIGNRIVYSNRYVDEEKYLNLDLSDIPYNVELTDEEIEERKASMATERERLLRRVESRRFGIKIQTFGNVFLIFAYPFYFLGCFIIWAIRTLREK